MALVGSQLIVSVLCDVSHPGKSLIAGLLDDLQVADLKQNRVRTVPIAITARKMCYAGKSEAANASHLDS
jgi:hypothetical protein